MEFAIQDGFDDCGLESLIYAAAHQNNELNSCCSNNNPSCSNDKCTKNIESNSHPSPTIDDIELDKQILGSQISSNTNDSLSPSSQNSILEFFTHSSGDFVIEEDSSSDEILLSPLQLLSGIETIDFHTSNNDTMRSPISLSIELEPFHDVCNQNFKGLEDDSLSPPPSRVLEMISTPVNRQQKLERGRTTRKIATCSSRAMSQHSSDLFKARPAETGVFVMNQRRNVSTPVIPKRGHTSSYNKNPTNLKYNLPSKHEQHLRPTPHNHMMIMTDHHHHQQPKQPQKRRRQLEPHEIDPTRQIHHFEIGCRCTKTNCLKLYCDCFQAGQVCNDNCECTKCKNTPAESGLNGIRTRMIKEILKRRPNAFQRRIRGVKDPETPCACKSSKCLKKYCQCFVQGRFCSNSCLCQNCHNRDDMNVHHMAAGVQGSHPTSTEVISRQTLPSYMLMLEDDSSNSSSHSTNLNALDALIDSSSSSNATTSFPTILSNEKRSYPNSNSYINTTISNVPPPSIPEIFKSTLPLLDPMGSQSSQLQPLQIPEVFRNSSSTSASTVPSEVFTNPNFWLKTDNWVNPQMNETRKSKKKAKRSLL